jgi:hypothetical protein
MNKAVLKGGDGTARCSWQGTDLPDPALGDLLLPLTARLVASGGAVCIEATFDAADVRKENRPAQGDGAIETAAERVGLLVTPTR